MSRDRCFVTAAPPGPDNFRSNDSKLLSKLLAGATRNIKICIQILAIEIGLESRNCPRRNHGKTKRDQEKECSSCLGAQCAELPSRPSHAHMHLTSCLQTVGACKALLYEPRHTCLLCKQYFGVHLGYFCATACTGIAPRT